MNKTKINLSESDNFFVQEAFKVLRTNIQFCGPDISVIAITSVHESEGKTTVTLELGRCMTELDKSVLVIDADMRKSVIAARHTSSKKVIGLSEVLTGMVNVEDAIYQTQYQNFYLMMSGQFPPNPTELLSNDNFKAIISGARKVFNYILIDTPPIGEVIDAAVVATHSDGTILVLDGESREKDAKYCVEQIQKGGSRILGVVRNNVKGDSHAHYGQKKHGYGYR